MLINSVIARLRWYLFSLGYPITMAVLAILIWLTPGIYAWIPAVFYALFCFLPLFGTDGRPYIPVLLFSIIACSTNISFVTLPYYLLLIGASFFVSLILFIVIHKLKYRRSDLFVALTILFSVFVVSYLFNAAKGNNSSQTAVFYCLGLFLCLLVYVLFSIALGVDETFPYLERTVVIFSLAIVFEIFIYLCAHGFALVDSNFTLGWAYTPQTASTLLCLSLPFYGLLFSQKHYWWLFGIGITIAGIIFLSVDSGLLCLIIGIIPLILLSFRSAGKNSPYISLASIVVIGVSFGLLLGLNEKFNSRVMTAIESLNLFNEAAVWRKALFDKAIESFRANPIVGESIAALVTNTGIVLSSNTILTVAVLGGSFGLIAYLFFEIRLYWICLKKKTGGRWLFFLFLIFFETIGLIDNTLFNFAILLFFLIANSTYQMSKRPDDIIVYDSFYQNYHPEKRRLP
jgi:hypothetical protein